MEFSEAATTEQTHVNASTTRSHPSLLWTNPSETIPTATFCEVCQAMVAACFRSVGEVIYDHPTCQRVVKTRRLQDSASVQFSRDPFMTQLKGLHHASWRHLFISAAQGCSFCRCLQTNMQRRDLASELEVETREAKTHPNWLKYEGFWMARANCFYLSIQLANSDAPLARGAIDFLVSFYGYRVEPEQAKRPNYIFDSSSFNTGDPLVLAMAYSWLTDCLSKHVLCEQQPRNHYFPPRLLRLKGDWVQLIEPKNSTPAGRYATLSYCWGRNPQHITLTTSNLETFLQGFPSSYLPKTFREAIQVAQAMDLDLIWIDALCILQAGTGSEEDWQRHLTEMTYIYSNCLLNIAVDHGDNADAGCFVRRNPDDIKPCTFALKTKSRRVIAEECEESERTVTEMYELTYNFHWDELETSPLSSRGWVHQERLLSPRVLHFGKRQLVWECKVLRACESHPRGTPSGNFRTTPFSLEGDFHPKSEYDDRNSWHRIVEHYSAAALTRSQDKLPAIAGIARAMCKVQASSYAAGLLACDLPQALMWRRSTSALGPPITPYRAPTWSWASLDGKILFVPARETGGRDLAHVENISFQYVDESNEYGQIKSGVIVMTAPLLRMAEWDTRFSNPSVTHNLKVELFSRESTDDTEAVLPLEGCFHLDESDLFGARSHMHLLFISYSGTQLYGLVLRPTETSAQQQAWVRIGTYSDRAIYDNEKAKHRQRLDCLIGYPRTTVHII